MSDDAAPVALDETEAGRAGFYALIGRLFFDAPDAVLLSQLSAGLAAVGDDDGAGATALGAAWRQLAAAAADADAAALRHEHAMLFVGVGKTPVTPYTSAYVPGVSPERHLLSLRQQLAQWGLAGDAAAALPEDHIAGVCDTMRYLIEQGAVVAMQKTFFEKFLYQQGRALCEQLAGAGPSPFYRLVARLTQVFLAVERESFEMISPPA